MGGIRRQRKKIITPGHPYDKVRIEQELPLVGEYGLRNKKELWKARTVLSKARQQARALLALPIEVRAQREKELLSRLANLGVLSSGSDLDSVLALDVRTVLNRRLQTIVFKKGLASSPYQARQFIAHRHIAIERAVATSPGRLIKINEEENIDYAPQSPLLEKSHPARTQAPPTSEEPPEKRESPKARQKPQDKPVPKREDKPVPKREDKPVPKREDKPVPKREDKPVPKRE
ncbi:MAG: 30S ribosomal protein S4, partial [Candidatus Heimdallarchaeota archaeon]|nr:30S ribosomal protein S4 [Candidatus Heimdallarchaeota archaeon]